MKDHHLQLNLAKTELLVVSANPSLHPNFSIHLVSSTITPSRTARNLRVVIDDQLSFTDHIATTARSCRFALYNIRKIRLFLSEQAAQLLVKALLLSRLDYCNALLAAVLILTADFNLVLVVVFWLKCNCSFSHILVICFDLVLV